MKHKWHKEICACANGAEIEMRMLNKEDNTWYEWENMSDILRFSNDYWWEYRIKPQPKEPQYLYVYEGYGKTVTSAFYCSEMLSQINDKMVELKYKGKIKLEVDDE